MIDNESYNVVVPNAESKEAALEVYNQYYSTDEQLSCGVLAIEIALIDNEEQL